MTQLVVVAEYCTKILQRGHSVDIIYLHFKKVFNSMPHRWLLAKRKAIWYRWSSTKMDWSFLTGRKQHVIKNSSYSNVTSGITPQESVLDPILCPQLEYGNTIWGPFYTTDQTKLDNCNVQKQPQGWIPSIRHLPYEQNTLDLPSLKRYDKCLQAPT